MPKNKPAKIFLYLIALGLGGLRARQPSIHGNVATRYEIMNISCHLWSSVEVTYVHPPHDIERKSPMPDTSFGRAESDRAVRRYHRKTRANLGPEVIAINS